MRPATALWGTALLVALSTAAFPLIDKSGRSPTLFVAVVLYGFGIARLVTSAPYAGTHHVLAFCCASVPNLLFFLIPAAGIRRVRFRRRQAQCPAAIILWCGFYLASFSGCFLGGRLIYDAR
jgi:hypothetical protein